MTAVATPTPAPVDPLDEVLNLAADVLGVARGRVRLDVGLRQTEVVTLTDAQPPERRLALVAQRQVRVLVKPGVSVSEDFDVDLHASVAAALCRRADEQVAAHDGAVDKARRELDEATRVRDRVAARRDRIAAIRDEGVARARAARGG